MSPTLPYKYDVTSQVFGFPTPMRASASRILRDIRFIVVLRATRFWYMFWPSITITALCGREMQQMI